MFIVLSFMGTVGSGLANPMQRNCVWLPGIFCFLPFPPPDTGCLWERLQETPFLLHRWTPAVRFDLDVFLGPDIGREDNLVISAGKGAHWLKALRWYHPCGLGVNSH